MSAAEWAQTGLSDFNKCFFSYTDQKTLSFNIGYVIIPGRLTVICNNNRSP